MRTRPTPVPSTLHLVLLALAAPAIAGSAVAGIDDCTGRFLPGPAVAGGDDIVTAVVAGTIPQGAKLFLAGRFKVMGDKVTNHAAAWNGGSWEAMNVELDCTDSDIPDIDQLLVYNSNLYACGRFDSVNGAPAGGLMRWTGLSWVPFTAGAEGGDVNGMVVFNNGLYVYGSFDTINGVAARGIARWNGVTFEPVGAFDAFTVEGAAVHNGQLVVTGWFSDIAGVPIHMVARWNGAQWLACSEGLARHGYSLASYNGSLFCAGGRDLGTPDLEFDGLNVWNGQTWSFLSGNDASVLAVEGGILYAGGFSDTIVGVPGHVASFNGTQWSALGEGLGSWGSTPGNSQEPYVRSIDQFSGQLYVGGRFSRAGSATVQNVARWNGASWSRVNPAQPSSDARPLYAVGRFGDSLVVGGYKRLHNDAPADTVGISGDGVNFTALPGNIGGTVMGFADYNGSLYAYGMIHHLNGEPIEGICRWNGSAWTSVGESVKINDVDTFARVYDSVEFQGKLVCAGFFNQAGNVPASRIAAWNGTSWSNLGAGTNGWIADIELHNGEIYAAGDFSLAGGVACDGFARWDGSAWHAVGRGDAIGEFTDMLAHDGELYAVNGNRLLRVVNNAWQVLSVAPDGLEGTASLEKLFTYRGELAVVGDYGDIGSYSVDTHVRIFRDGQWVVLNPALYNDSVADATEFRGRLITVGEFTAVGSVVAPGIARYEPEAPYIWDQPDEAQSPCPGSTVHFSIQSVGGPIQVLRWKRNGAPLNNGPTGTGSSLAGTTTPTLTISNVSSADDGIYTCTVTTSCGSDTSDTVRLIVSCPFTPCGPADLGGPGGVVGADGQLNNNDFIAFINLFFQEHPAADLGIQGGLQGSDGQFDNNDFIAFISLFFQGC